jgi:sulfite reductase (NADPH) hemoprotein beta-component
MYRYDEYDHRLVEQRVAQFREQVRRRLDGELSEDEFRPFRLMNGLYLQLHAYMLRIAIPYGTLSSAQLRKLADIARRYDRSYGHFTTRQNLQLNWIRLVDVPDILAELASVEMHAIQTSGNCIRNVTADHFAGVAADEIEDGRVWAEIVRQWSTLHPEFSFLPRKFKIAVSGSPNDRAALRLHDIGLRLHRNDAGETGFEVMVGGGQGRTPFIAKTIRDFLPQHELLSYLEAILRTYNLLGRRDNKYKARIKILVHEVGAAKIAELVEAEWAEIRGGALTLPDAEIERIRAHFAPPPYRTLPELSATLERHKIESPTFARWLRTNTTAHKVPGYAAVTISLKPVGGIPGDATDTQMELVADLADRFSFGEIRVTHAQNLILAHVSKEELFPLWQALSAQGLGTANRGLIGDIIACPGLDYCALANARAIPIAQAISAYFADAALAEDIGQITLNISGCINACGHHHVGHIGILGVDKKGVEFYQITIGGASDNQAAIGTILGPALPADRVVDAIATIVATYRRIRKARERFIDTVRRTGTSPFKEDLYAVAA